MSYTFKPEIFNTRMKFGDFCKKVGGRADRYEDLRQLDNFPKRVKVIFHSARSHNMPLETTVYADFTQLSVFRGATDNYQVGSIHSYSDIITILRNTIDIDKLYEDIKEF